MYPVLYVAPVMSAMLTLPLRQAVSWTAAYTVATATSFAVGFGPGEGLIALFLYGVIYAFIGAFAGEAPTLLVSDDGKGLLSSTGQNGFGLQGLGERAGQLGGELHVEPRPGGGTQLSFRLPLAKETDDA
jgi:hypothetical protein